MDFDEFVDVSLSVDVLLHALSMTGRDPLYWKWAIIAAHGAVSGACVCRLTQTDGSGAIDTQSTTKLRRWLAEYSSGDGREAEEVPRLRLASLSELLRRLPGDLAVDVPREFDPAMSGEARDFWLLNKWRSEFIHFKPQSWSIELSGLPLVIRSAVQKVCSIIRDPHDRYPRYRSDLIHRLEAAEKLLDGLEVDASAVD